MECPKCGKPLDEKMFCENCEEYLFNMDKPKKGDIAKSWLKIFGITIGCFALFAIIVMGIVELSVKRSYSKEMTSQYNEIYQEYSDKEYYSALVGIENFKNKYGDKKSAKINKLINDIELALYDDMDSETNGISSCNTYLEFYPNGKYADEVKKSLYKLSDKKALKDIQEAKSNISKNDYLEADSILQSILNDDYVSSSTKKQAREIIESISSIVANEKGKEAIVGTWHKETGVNYTFEEDGHMSVSLSQNYDSSKGTSLDGHEVVSLLKEINESGRVHRGGFWEYTGCDADKNGEYWYYYILTYYGSQYKCMIKSGINQLGIYVPGLTDMSVLTK